MAIERFEAYIKKNENSLAPHVLYYRDGISTGQCESVLADEVPAIKTAWSKVWPTETTDVKVTAIVVVKRHHRRLFPLKEAAHKKGNCKAGTLVDSGIVSPFFSEFFLQSHHALKDTAIPTRYFVLENGSKYSDNDIQSFTHKLCYTYVRAKLGVSYAPPAYYTDCLCERGCQYLRDWFTPNYDSDHYKNYQAMKDQIEKNAKTILDQQIAALPQQPIPAGRRRARKSTQQAGMERRSRQATETAIENKFRQEAYAYFEKGRKGGPGPWHPSLDDTMFWM
jgi:eukaryotic translation initiation factor 2C